MEKLTLYGNKLELERVRKHLEKLWEEGEFKFSLGDVRTAKKKR